MLEAFILGFWCIWSADRDMAAGIESFTFLMVCTIVRAAMAAKMPEFGELWAAGVFIQWVYVAITFWLLNRFARAFTTTLIMGAIASVGFYRVEMRLVDWAPKLLEWF